MKKFLDKVLKLNSWSWVALFGYINFLLFLILFILGYNDPSGSLLVVFVTLIVLAISVIVIFLQFISEIFDKEMVKKLINNKVAIIFGCILYFLPIFLILILMFWSN